MKVALTPLSPWPGWRFLPRDARDTLFLLGVIGWTVLPHVAHLPVWCTLLTLVVLLWRARLALSNAALPNRWVLVGVLLVAAGLTFWSFRTLLGKEPGVTMAVVLMALKTLELRARRDAFVVFFLGFFLVLTHFLYSQSIVVAAAMLGAVWGLLTSLVLAHMPVGQPSLRIASKLAMRTALLGAPIMVMLFLLFPRMGPLWGVPQDGLAATGLSNSMRLGSVAEVAQDDSIAMRVRFDSTVPPPERMYFRGPVLSRFDGVEWRARPPSYISPPPASSQLHVRGAPVRYELTLEPQRVAAVPLLEAAASAPAIEGVEVSSRGDLQWAANRPLMERVRFKAEAYVDFELGVATTSAQLYAYRELPPGYNPRTLEWAAALRRDPAYANADARTLARVLLQHIRRGGYSYTLAPGEYGHDAIDEFWLDRRAGFCEHYAAAFVVVMRALDVPARVVTGYQGTDPLPQDGYYIVRQSSAHAWAEYWQEGVGWIRADPTAAVAPDRISRARRLVAPAGIVAATLDTLSPDLLAGMRGAWETMNNRWNQWVLNYSRGQQLDVLKSLGFASPSWEDLALLLIGSLSGLALLGAVWAWWDRHRVDPWVRQMDGLRAAMRKLGLSADPHDTPRSLAQRLRARYGAQGDAAAALLDALDLQRYGRGAATRPDPALTRRFAMQARRLRGLPAAR